MNNRVFYLISGPAHLPYMLVSLYTLRQHWFGKVVIYAWPESYDIVKRVSLDLRLGPDTYVVKREPEYRGKNCQFIDKIKIAMEEPADKVLYLDADTTIHGDIEPLFTELQLPYTFLGTQWNDWVTTGRSIKGRIEDLREFVGRGIDEPLINKLQVEPYPSVNGGVWSCMSGSPVLRKWLEYTWTARSKFIADEKCLHLMMTMFPSQMGVVGSCGVFNSSPKHKSKLLPLDQVRIYHYHGDSNCRLQKSKIGVQLWWPIYQHCLNQDIGSMAKWRKDIKNRHLDKCEEEMSEMKESDRIMCG